MLILDCEFMKIFSILENIGMQTMEKVVSIVICYAKSSVAIP